MNIYTDGACLGNPGPGGWGAIVTGDGEDRPLSGADPATTNNRMELMAAIKGIEAVAPGRAVTIHSDSQYLVNTMTKNWKRSKNQDLWARLDTLAAERQVSWKWVRGHAGHTYNEKADRLAVAAAYRIAGRGVPAGGAAEPAPLDPAQKTLSHVDDQGRARMVDVGAKPATARLAVAQATLTMRTETLALIAEGRMEKGDVFTVARLAGIGAAKKTWDLIPLAHQVPLSHVSVDFEPDPATGTVAITATTRTTAQTGVEMEALTAVSIAALTVYDMCKAVDRAMEIGPVRLLEKRGGQRGDYRADA